MIIDNTEAVSTAKDVIYDKIKSKAHSSWGWANINDVISEIMNEEPPSIGMMFTENDLVFAYWILLGEGKIWGDSPIVKVDNIDRVVWLGDIN